MKSWVVVRGGAPELVAVLVEEVEDVAVEDDVAVAPNKCYR